MERGRLICYLIGFHTGKNENSPVETLLKSVNQHLESCNQPPINESENEILKELTTEIVGLTYSKHGIINRKTRRYYGVKGL